MPWKIVKTEKEVVVTKDDLGSFKEKEDAITEAKKLAREHKLVAKIYDNRENTHSTDEMTIDYTSFFNSQEIHERSLSELKLAKAEVNVAKLELEQRRKELKSNKNEFEKITFKAKVRNAKIRFKKAKLNLKAAEKRIKLQEKKEI
ncbi:hypothetical protein [Mesoplasma coleopterae]|uniref:Uncharacterized protein n=2 Tax=Mesoplasma coleopterae TaxID=324078 RepID=A0A2K8P251_9MOLU|nr:hypothetical protein [Mesoplasma coleopterae]ATZ20756.1 hypothetical protein MCOLE_v1c02420 [Mesoplasma coleopterae]AVN62264.1 hypothetical protein CG001_01200 [Mesoplasma coleopterae]AVN62932.1 hypothetical protein CG000_01270 [Mesoplasma coleopterae]